LIPLSVIPISSFYCFIKTIFFFFFFSAGGLVTAVAPVVIDCEGLWVGWTGLDDFNEKIETIPESDPGDKAPTAGLLSRQVKNIKVIGKGMHQWMS
jgi:trehalose-6-phosphate synthase